MSTVVAVVLLLAVMAYAVFGGADFGAGFWDLTAGGPERGARPRAVIERAVGPVWEANHVWLIFIFVVLWTSFPEAYASITLTLFVPLTLAALGIVLRGASFAFRKVVVTLRYRRDPRCGLCVIVRRGAVLHGRHRRGHRLRPGARRGQGRRRCGQLDQPDVGPLWRPGVAVAAYLSAVYLVWDARRMAGTAMVTYFRLRAVAAAVVIAVIGVVSIFVLRSDAGYLADGLSSEALPLVILSVVSGVGALVLLVRDAALGARALAAVAVASLVVGWGVAQWPYLLPESLTFSAAAAPSGSAGRGDGGGRPGRRRRAAGLRAALLPGSARSAAGRRCRRRCRIGGALTTTHSHDYEGAMT